MKKSIIIMLILISFIFTMNANADTPLKKLGRGLANIGTSPLEIFKGMSDANKESGFISAFTWGVLKGVWNTGRRAVVGVYEVISFPVPVPENYAPIIEDPEFFGEEALKI